VLEFGASEVVVDDRPVQPRLAKGHTLLALLATKPGAETARRSVIEQLFESDTDKSTVAYLRLAVRSARDALPDGVDLTLDREAVRFAPAAALTSESVRFETLIGGAAGLVGEERLRALLSALDLYGKGPYLGRESSPWAHERRRDLDDLAEDSLLDASGAAFELAEYAEAETLVREAITRNRFRESAWRLLMRIAAATRRPRHSAGGISGVRERRRRIGRAAGRGYHCPGVRAPSLSLPWSGGTQIALH
jgi:two-component SAPR family response regulator